MEATSLFKSGPGSWPSITVAWKLAQERRLERPPPRGLSRNLCPHLILHTEWSLFLLLHFLPLFVRTLSSTLTYSCLPTPQAFPPLQVLSLACNDLSTAWPPTPALPSHWLRLPTSSSYAWLIIRSVPQSWPRRSFSPPIQATVKDMCLDVSTFPLQYNSLGRQGPSLYLSIWGPEDEYSSQEASSAIRLREAGESVFPLLTRWLKFTPEQSQSVIRGPDQLFVLMKSFHFIGRICHRSN